MLAANNNGAAYYGAEQELLRERSTTHFIYHFACRLYRIAALADFPSPNLGAAKAWLHVLRAVLLFCPPANVNCNAYRETQSSPAAAHL